MDNTSHKLSLKEKISYGFGDLASVLYWQTFMLYFTYFYTDVFLIPASVAATMFLISRLWDGVNDPLMGIIADRTKSRWGKFRPYLLWLCVPFAIAGVLAFTTPDFGMSGKVIWAYATFFLIMMLYTAINIPYTSLMGVISPNSIERTSVSSVKFIFAFAAGIIISATLLPMTKTLGKGDNSIMEAKIKNEQLVVNENKRGVSTFFITAYDSNKGKTVEEIRFTVSPTDNNTPRITNPIEDITLNQNFKQYSIDLSKVFHGSAYQDFSFSVKNTNSELISANINNGILVLSEVSNQLSGTADLAVVASDKKWGDQTETFAVSVLNQNNTAPHIVDSSEVLTLDSGFEKHNINLNTIFTDIENDNLQFSAESGNYEVIKPEINNTNLEFVEIKNGISSLTIVADDGKGGRTKHTLKVIVRNPDENNAPFITASQTGYDVAEGFGSYSISLNEMFNDVDGDNVQYELVVVNEAKGWSRFFMIVGAAAIIFFLITFFGTRERVLPPKNQKTNVKQDLKELVTNKPWLILLATTITFILFVAVRGSVTVHYFKYVIGSQSVALPFIGEKIYDFVTLTSAYNTIGQISSLLGVVSIPIIASKIGKKKTFMLFFIVAIFSTAILYVLTAKQLGLIFFFQITGSFTGGPLSALLWAMYADTADYAEWKKGRRATGLIFSASTMSQKIGWAVGAYLALTLMSQVGFQPNIDQNPESLRGLLLLFSLIPAALGVVSVIISLAYPLNEKRVAEIEADLTERRKKDQESE